MDFGTTSPDEGLVSAVPAAPSDESQPCGMPDGSRHQRWCQADVPVGAGRCPRCQVWQPSNLGALKTRAFSRQTPEQPDALLAMFEKREALVRHVGAASVIQQDVINDYATVDVLIDTVTANIVTLGVLTTKGRTRAAVSLLLQLLDRRVRYAGLLGMKAEAKDVDFARAFQEQERNPG